MGRMAYCLDTIDSGDGADTVNAGGGDNEIWLRGGNDQVTAGAGNDTINGGAGTDTCTAGGGVNNVNPLRDSALTTTDNQRAGRTLAGPLETCRPQTRGATNAGSPS